MTGSVQLIMKISAAIATAAVCLVAAPAPSFAGTPLRWEPPALTSPVRVAVTESKRVLSLDPARDYEITMPGAPLTGSGGLTIVGGRNVVLRGGHISIPWQGPAPAAQSRRGLYLKGQTGVVHVEGLRIDGPDLAEGINLDQRAGAIVQLQNIHVGEVRARDLVKFTDTHPDVIQTWGGPEELRIDGLTGTTSYQGLFLAPTQYDKTATTRLADISRVNIRGTSTSAYLLWQASSFPMRIRDVWVSRAQTPRPRYWAWPSSSAWSGYQVGVPAAGDFVPSQSVGIGYTSPGYAAG
jgi:hypothetical protein